MLFITRCLALQASEQLDAAAKQSQPALSREADLYLLPSRMSV